MLRLCFPVHPEAVQAGVVWVPLVGQYPQSDDLIRLLRHVVRPF